MEKGEGVKGTERKCVGFFLRHRLKELSEPRAVRRSSGFQRSGYPRWFGVPEIQWRLFLQHDPVTKNQVRSVLGLGWVGGRMWNVANEMPRTAGHLFLSLLTESEVEEENQGIKSLSGTKKKINNNELVRQSFPRGYLCAVVERMLCSKGR